MHFCTQERAGERGRKSQRKSEERSVKEGRKGGWKGHGSETHHISTMHLATEELARHRVTLGENGGKRVRFSGCALLFQQSKRLPNCGLYAPMFGFANAQIRIQYLRFNKQVCADFKKDAYPTPRKDISAWNQHHTLQ
jgi:hypothetical protein